MDVSNLKKLPNGKGAFGQCYIVDDKTLYKQFFKLYNGTYPFEKDYFNNLVDIENTSFVFPKEIYKEGAYTIGYTMDYIHADNLQSLSLDFPITDFICSLDILKEDLRLITNQNILIADVNSNNILYDGLFHIIDTDLFIKENKPTIYQMENEKYLTEYLYRYFVEENNAYEFYDLVFLYEELDYAYKIINKEPTINNLKDFLFELRDALIKETGYESDNFKDMYKIIKSRKK